MIYLKFMILRYHKSSVVSIYRITLFYGSPGFVQKVVPSCADRSWWPSHLRRWRHGSHSRLKNLAFNRKSMGDVFGITMTYAEHRVYIYIYITRFEHTSKTRARQVAEVSRFKKCKAIGSKNKVCL